MIVKNITKGNVHLGPFGLLQPGEFVEIPEDRALGILGNGIVECHEDGSVRDVAGERRTAARQAERSRQTSQTGKAKAPAGGAETGGSEGGDKFPEVVMPEADAKGFITKAQGIELAAQFGMSQSVFSKQAKEIPGTVRDGDKANSPLLIPAKSAMTFLATWWKEQHAEG